MSAERYDKGRRAASNLSNKTEFSSRISEAVEQVHSVRTLQIVAGICQVLLGLSVAAVAAMGLISPLWLATLLSVVASIATVTGAVFLYVCVFRSTPVESLIRDAIHRIMNARN